MKLEGAWVLLLFAISVSSVPIDRKEVHQEVKDEEQVESMVLYFFSSMSCSSFDTLYLSGHGSVLRPIPPRGDRGPGDRPSLPGETADGQHGGHQEWPPEQRAGSCQPQR